LAQVLVEGLCVRTKGKRQNKSETCGLLDMPDHGSIPWFFAACDIMTDTADGRHRKHRRQDTRGQCSRRLPQGFRKEIIAAEIA
jgi:hypothetical protein